MDFVRKIEQLGTDSGKQSGLVKIVDCGEMSEKKSNVTTKAEKGDALSKTEDVSTLLQCHCLIYFKRLLVWSCFCCSFIYFCLVSREK